MLIDAAMDLCLKQGYEQTTVEQIAAAADVSPRTFSRYFATKDAVFLTLIEDYADEVAIELETVHADVGPLEAMRQAHVAVLTRVATRRVGRLTTERIVLMLRVINASETLKQAAFEFRHDVTRSCSPSAWASTSTTAAAPGERRLLGHHRRRVRGPGLRHRDRPAGAADHGGSPERGARAGGRDDERPARPPPSRLRAAYG